MTRKPARFSFGLGKLLPAFALATTLCAVPAVHANVLDFESPVDNPFVFSDTGFAVGSYLVEGAGDGGLVGAIGTNDLCAGLQCPINNSSNYYSSLNDGYLYISNLDKSGFRIDSLAASFIGAGLDSYPALAGILVIVAFDDDGIVDATALGLAGPSGAANNFGFATYDLTGFAYGRLFTSVLIEGFACDGTGDCLANGRSNNQANFAIDDIVTVPEPTSLLLLALGLTSLAVARRRAA